ncbi:hypothetical protein FRC07_006792 [Ceratobasidium sp. 392]|nr:hypothetical protein FRC07_006792 [Ceratobasidium sp. 392]
MIPTPEHIDVNAPVYIDVDAPIHVDVDALDVANAAPAVSTASTATTIDNFQDINVKAPLPSDKREFTIVEEFDSHFSCPTCQQWQPSSDSRALRGCGHVYCVTCWDSWCAACRGDRKPLKCPLCCRSAHRDDTVCVEFKAPRFNSERKLVEEVVRRTKCLDDDTARFRTRLAEMRRVIEDQKAQLRELEGNLEEISRLNNATDRELEGNLDELPRFNNATDSFTGMDVD